MISLKYLNPADLILYLSSPAILHIYVSHLHLSQAYSHSNHETTNDGPNNAFLIAHNDETSEVPVYLLDNPTPKKLNTSAVSTIQDEHDLLVCLILISLINPFDYINCISVVYNTLIHLHVILT